MTLTETMMVYLYTAIGISLLVLIRRHRKTINRQRLVELFEVYRKKVKQELQNKYGEIFADCFDKFYMEIVSTDLFRIKMNNQEKIIDDLAFQLKEYGLIKNKFNEETFNNAINYSLGYAEKTLKEGSLWWTRR